MVIQMADYELTLQTENYRKDIVYDKNKFGYVES